MACAAQFHSWVRQHCKISVLVQLQLCDTSCIEGTINVYSAGPGGLAGLGPLASDALEGELGPSEVQRRHPAHAILRQCA